MSYRQIGIIGIFLVAAGMAFAASQQAAAQKGGDASWKYVLEEREAIRKILNDYGRRCDPRNETRACAEENKQLSIRREELYSKIPLGGEVTCIVTRGKAPQDEFMGSFLCRSNDFDADFLVSNWAPNCKGVKGKNSLNRMCSENLFVGDVVHVRGTVVHMSDLSDPKSRQVRMMIHFDAYDCSIRYCQKGLEIPHTNFPIDIKLLR